MRFYGLFILLLRHKIKILLMQLFSVHKSSIRTLCMLIWCRSKFNVKNDNVDFDLATYYCYFFFAYKSVLFFLVMANSISKLSQLLWRLMTTASAPFPWTFLVLLIHKITQKMPKILYAKLWNQFPSLDHFVVQNSGDFLCWKYKEVVCFYVSNLRQ